MSETIIKFKVGEKYLGRFISNYDSVHIAEIVRRTEKSVWVKDIFSRKIIRKKIYTYGNEENFSMCSGLSIFADKKVVT